MHFQRKNILKNNCNYVKAKNQLQLHSQTSQFKSPALGTM
jgi:hypothetical protein